MEENTLKLIQRTALEADALRQSALGHSNAIALPDDYRIHDLETFQAGRRRFRGLLNTDSIADFVGYVKRRAGEERPVSKGELAEVRSNGTAEVPGFIATEKLSANALFNLGTAVYPGHADDRAVLTMKPTAPYAALTAVNGRQLAHKDAIDWLEDWSEQIAFSDGEGQAISTGAALTAIRKITIRATAESTSSQENFRSTRSALEDVEARGAANLPAEVQFTCTPHSGLPARTFRLRLGILTSTDKPVLVLRVRNLEAEQEAIAQDFKRVLFTELEGVATLTIGTFTP